jgi:transcriptional antiterminator RfaH
LGSTRARAGNARRTRGDELTGMSFWHVVVANAGREEAAARSIGALGIEVYLPRYARRARNSSSVVHRPLFPGYLFVFFSPDESNWPMIFSRRGVKGMILDDGRLPRRVPAAQMDRVRLTADELSSVVHDGPPLSRGQVVKIIAGAFDSFRGVVRRADESKVDVEISVFGRATKTTLPRASVTPINS